VIQREATRLGLTNDNDYIWYTFGAAYNLKPHRLQLDLAYFRDRFTGAPTGTTVGVDPSPPSAASRSGLGFQGQQLDAVMIMPSWSGTFGPLAGLLQMYILAGTAESSNRAAVAGSNRDFDIFSVGLLAYAEAKLGVVAPFVGFVYGTGDGDPTDTTLHGFHFLPPQQHGAAYTGTARFAHLDRVVSLGGRDIKTPARAAGANGIFGGSQFGHSVGSPLNDRLGNRSHAGINTTLSNPGLISPFVGLKVFPVKQHEIVGTYVYRSMADTAVLESALGVPISKALYHSLNAYWMWNLSRHFDIRLSGSVIIPLEGVKDIARTSRTFPCTAAVPCQGDDPALWAEARVRARF
jgi:hypothetical protein